MAITGVLNADFSNFVTEVKKAEVSLKGMEGGAVKTEAALSHMSTGTGPQINSLRESISQVDQTLGTAGISVGKYARALDEMAQMSGKTAKEIGALATGASIFSAAMAGWQFGTWIAGITGLDKAVQRYADSLTNLPAEVAAAKQDTINRAIANGAKETITYAEAVKFNVQHVQDLNDAHAVSAERLAAAQREVRGLSEARIAEIEIAKKNGATVAEITRHFDISADALRALADRQKLAGQMADAHTKALEKQQAEVAKLDASYEKLMSDTKNANQLAIMEADAQRMATDALNKKNAAATAWISQQVKVKAGIDAEAAATEAYLKEQEALTAATDALSKTHTEAGAAAQASTAVATQGYSGLATQVQITGDAIKEWINLMKYSAEVNAILSTNSLFTTTSQHQQIAALSRGGGGGGGGVMNFNMGGIVGDREELARTIKQVIVDHERESGRRL